MTMQGQEELLALARELLTPAAIRDSREWVEKRIQWHRLDGNDALADEMLAKENDQRRAMAWQERR